MEAVKAKSVHRDPDFDHDVMRDPFYDDGDDPAPALREYVAEVWRYRPWVAAAAVLIGSLMFVLDLFTPKIYVGTATLQVDRSKIGDAALTVTPLSFLPIIANHTTAAEIIKERHLDGPPYNLTPMLFFRGAVDVNVIRGTNLIEVTARFRDPQLAADIANEVALRGVELAGVFSREEAVRGREMLAGHMDELRKNMETARTRLLDFKRTAQVEVLRGDVEAKLKQRSELPKLLGLIASERASYERWERERAGRDKLNVTTKSIERDPTMMEAVRSGGGNGGSGDGSTSSAAILPLEMRSEEVNRVYTNIDSELAKSSAKLAGLERQRTQLIETASLNSAEMKSLTELYHKEAELAQLQLDNDISVRAYGDVAARHESLRIQIAGRSAEVQVVDVALPFDIPIRPKPIRDTLFGAIIGMGAAVSIIVARKGLAPPPPRPTPARLAS